MTGSFDHGAAADLFDHRYRLHHGIARVTSGGSVYAAQHAFTKKSCAIKVLDANARDIVRKRAMREMEALVRTQGPGIVEFRDAGEFDGQLFMVMALLEGRTLGGLLAARGRLAVTDALNVCSRISAVLARCHGVGVTHRDVKPLNVHVNPSGEVHLLDFGIAKIADPETARVEKLTLENTILGTPEYMAPEALLASPDADDKVDQYALAVTMFECLTGGVPFEGSRAQVAQKMSHAPPPIRAIRTDVPVALEQWVMRALRRDPAERFPDMKTMHDELAAIAAGGSNEGEEVVARVAPTIADSPVAMRPQTRRRHPRAPYASLARIQREDQSQLDGRVEEISESGCQFVADRTTNNGEKVVLRFALPISGRIVDLPGVCRWTRATRVAMAAGFEFVSVPNDPLAEIRKYVGLMSTES